MIFEDANPFPLVKFDVSTYTEAQAHAVQADRWLDLRAEETEAQLRGMKRDVVNSEGLPQQLWLDLPVSALLTPYLEIRWMLSLLDLRAGDTIIDCGAGYGRMAFVIEEHYPEVNFVGYEYVTDRVKETNRVFKARALRRSVMQEADLSLSSFELPSAQFYFIYDFGSKQAVRKLLANLQTRAEKPLTVIGRGRLVRDLIEQETPWLSQVIYPRHFAHFSIYSTSDKR